MSITAVVWKNAIKLGTGTATAGSKTISSFTVFNNGGLANDVNAVVRTGRNVQVACTGGVSSNGVFNTMVATDGGTTLTLADVCPFT